MTHERQPLEKPKNNVCLLIIQKKDRIVVEPSDSENLDARVVKALSYKFADPDQIDQALADLGHKYKLPGIFNSTEKTEKIKTFKHEGKTFHVFHTNHKGNLQLDGKFRFIKAKDLLKMISVHIKGEGDCMVTQSLKMALESNLDFS